MGGCLGIRVPQAGVGVKILHVIPSVAESGGGPSRAIASMETALSDLGVHVTTVTTDDGLDKGTPPASKHRIYFPLQLRPYKVSLPMARWLSRHVAEFDAVHVHALFSFAPVVAAQSARARGVPYVIRPLGVLNHYGMRERRSLFKRASVRWIEGPLLRDAAAVHFTSELELHEATSLGVTMRSQVLPLGVAPVPSGSPTALLDREPHLAGRRILLYLSRLDPKKNLEALLDALPRVVEVHPEVCLLVCGDGTPDYVRALKARARDRGMDGHVVWAGHVRADEKSAAFSLAEVYVLPSWSENFGIAPVEALWAGLPSILGRGVAVAEAIEAAGAGLAIDPDADGLVAALLTVLGNETWRRQAGERARKLAHERYSVEAMGAGLLEMYTRLAGPTPRERA